MSRTVAVLAALVVLLPGLGGCSTAVPDAEADVAALVTDGRVDVAALTRLREEFAGLDETDKQRRLADLDVAVETGLWERAGLVDDLGGADAAQAFMVESQGALRALIASDTGQLDSLSLGRGVGLVDDLGEAGGAAMFAAMLLTGSAGEMALSVSSNGERGVLEHDGIRVDATADKPRVTTKHKVKIKGVTVKVLTDTTMQFCPDAQGRFELRGSLTTSTSKGSKGSTRSVSVVVRGQVGDDAELASQEMDTTAEDATYGGSADYNTVMVDKAGPAFEFEGSEQSGPHVSDTVRVAVFLANWMRLQLLDSAEKGWKSGRCVELETRTSDGPTGLQPSATVDITATPRATSDGAPTGGTVVATLKSGGTAVEPNGSPLDAPASFVYTAPDEPDRNGTVTLVATSRRGIGRATVDLDTRQSAYAASGGGGDWSATGTICSLTDTFSVSGTGLTATFSPSSAAGGTYTLSGNAAGVLWSGGGDYSVKLSGGGGVLRTQGTNTIKTSIGTFSDTYSATFNLSPLDTCG